MNSYVCPKCCEDKALSEWPVIAGRRIDYCCVVCWSKSAMNSAQRSHEQRDVSGVSELDDGVRLLRRSTPSRGALSTSPHNGNRPQPAVETGRGTSEGSRHTPPDNPHR